MSTYHRVISCLALALAVVLVPTEPILSVALIMLAEVAAGVSVLWKIQQQLDQPPNTGKSPVRAARVNAAS